MQDPLRCAKCQRLFGEVKIDCDCCPRCKECNQVISLFSMEPSVPNFFKCHFRGCNADVWGSDNRFYVKDSIVFSCEKHAHTLNPLCEELEGIEMYFKYEIYLRPYEVWSEKASWNKLWNKKVGKQPELIPFIFLLRNYFHTVLKLSKLLSNSWEGQEDVQDVCKAII